MKIDYTLEDIHEVARKLLNHVNSNIVFLYGDMGAGKTTLVKALVNVLGCEDDVSSPTFSIVNEYKTKDRTIYHFDLYRIKSMEEAHNFGIEDYLFTDALSIVEWPELIENYVTECTMIKIGINNDNSRSLVIN